MSSNVLARTRPWQRVAFAAAGIGALLIGSIAMPRAEAASAKLDDVIYWMMNPSNGRSVLTPWAGEVASGAKYNYTESKQMFYGSQTAESGMIAVYRLHKGANGDFLNTASVTERDNLVATQGYQNQGVSFYAEPVDDNVTEPVYRYVKNGIHRMAITPAEQTALANDGWTKEVATFYAKPLTPFTTPTPTHPGDGDNKFSFAILPDTQQETAISGDQFEERTRYIAGQVTPRDIRFVGHTGDIVSSGGNHADTANRYQYEVASNAYRSIDTTNVPYLLSPGNHDTAAVCAGGGACPGQDVRTNIRNTAVLNEFFPDTRLKLTAAQEFEAGKIDNSYHKFTAEGTKWLVIALEMHPRVAVINWAKGVVAAHPDHNIAFTSHYILEGSGAISTSTSGYGDTSGRYMYDNLFLAYPNVKLVFSGHVGQAATRTDTGVNGNKVVGFVGAFHQNDYNPTRFVTVDVINNSVSSDIQAASIRDAYKAAYPNSTLPTYDEYDVTHTGMSFIK